jgi:hypothetical protein
MAAMTQGIQVRTVHVVSSSRYLDLYRSYSSLPMNAKTVPLTGQDDVLESPLELFTVVCNHPIYKFNTAV